MFSCTTWESDVSPEADYYDTNNNNNANKSANNRLTQQQQHPAHGGNTNNNGNDRTTNLTDDEMITKVLTEGLKLKKKNKQLLNQINELTSQYEKDKEKLTSEFQAKMTEMEVTVKKIKDSCVLEISQIQDQKAREMNVASQELNEMKGKYNQLVQKNKSIQYEKEQIINQFHQEMNHLRIEYENEKKAFLELQKFKHNHYSRSPTNNNKGNNNTILQENASNSMRRDDMSNNDEQRSILIRRAMLAEAEVEKLNEQLIKVNERVTQLQSEINSKSSTANNLETSSPHTDNSSNSSASTPTITTDNDSTAVDIKQEYEQMKASLKDEMDQRMILENELHELRYELSYLKSSVLIALTTERDQLLEKCRQFDESNRTSNRNNNKIISYDSSSHNNDQQEEIKKLQSANQQKYELLLRAKNEIVSLKNQIDVFVNSKQEVAEGVRIVTKQNEELQEKIRLMTLEIKDYRSQSVAGIACSSR